MKNKKYNTSLKSLYEGYETLGNVYHQRAGGNKCNIDVPDNVRQFLFSVGDYSAKDESGKESYGHEAVVGYISSSIPFNIFRNIEKAIASKSVFDALMSGPVADFSKLFLSEVDCAVIQLGLNNLSLFLSKTSFFKMSNKDKQLDLKNKEAAAATALGTTALNNPEASIYTTNISLHREQERKTNANLRRLKVDAFKFNSIFRRFKDSNAGADINMHVFYFENFFKTYYDEKKWDVNKLKEDIDVITTLAKKCKRIPSRGSLVNIYHDFMNTINVKPVNETEILLKTLNKNVDADGRKYFKNMLGLLIFFNGPKEYFYAGAYNIMISNRKLDKQFSNDIKETLSEYSNIIRNIFD